MHPVFVPSDTGMKSVHMLETAVWLSGVAIIAVALAHLEPDPQDSYSQSQSMRDRGPFVDRPQIASPQRFSSSKNEQRRGLKQ